MRWSINQIVEYLVLIENAIQGVIGKMSEAPEAPPGFEAAQMDGHTTQIHELKAEPDFLQTSSAAATLQ